MSKSSALRALVSEWAWYLQQRGHRFKQYRGTPDVLRSQNGRGMRYRWLFLHSGGPARRLAPIERHRIKLHLGAGQAAGELVYVVTKFEKPESKVVVLPAEKAVGSARLEAGRGGIPWDW